MDRSIALSALFAAAWTLTAEEAPPAPVRETTPPPAAAEVEPMPVEVAADPGAGRWSRPWSIDLRLLLGSAAPIDEIEDDDGTTEINAGASGSFRVQGLWGYRPGGGRVGFQLGGGLSFGGHGGDFGGEEDALQYAYAAFEFTGGLLAVPTPGLQFEVRPFLRLGAGELDADELEGVDQDDVEAGGYVAGGLVAGMWYAWGGGFQLGGEVGLEGFAGTNDVDGETVDVTGGGGFGAIGLGWRW